MDLAKIKNISKTKIHMTKLIRARVKIKISIYAYTKSYFNMPLYSTQVYWKIKKCQRDSN